MQLTKIVIGIVLFTSISACSLLDPLGWFRPKKIDLKFNEVKVDPKVTSGCSTENDLSLTPGAPVQNQTITITRKFRREITRGCNNEVTRDYVATVDHPNGKIVIKPAGDVLAKNYWVKVTNRNTCSAKSSWYSAQAKDSQDGVQPTLSVRVHTSPTLFDMHILKSRENFLDYQITSCSTIEKDFVCKDPISIEKGTLILNVVYEEETLPTRDTKVCKTDP